jgi:hypothetical protein
MPFKRGDHVCAIYSATEELIREVARFLAEGVMFQSSADPQITPPAHRS